MAIVSAYYETGKIVRMFIRNSDMEWWDNTDGAMEEYASGDFADYAVTAGEIGSTGEYYATWPAALTTTGTYTVQFAPLADEETPYVAVESDLLNRFAAGTYYWDGTSLYPVTLGALIDGKTLQQALQYIAAVCAGKISGAGTAEEIFLGLDGTSTRVTVVADEDGNRTGVTYTDE